MCAVGVGLINICASVWSGRVWMKVSTMRESCPAQYFLPSAAPPCISCFNPSWHPFMIVHICTFLTRPFLSSLPVPAYPESLPVPTLRGVPSYQNPLWHPFLFFSLSWHPFLPKPLLTFLTDPNLFWDPFLSNSSWHSIPCWLFWCPFLSLIYITSFPVAITFLTFLLFHPFLISLLYQLFFTSLPAPNPLTSHPLPALPDVPSSPSSFRHFILSHYPSWHPFSEP